jgi:hypothetical protein
MICTRYADLPGDFRTSRNLKRWFPQPSDERIKKSRFTEERMVKILREADDRPVTEVDKGAIRFSFVGLLRTDAVVVMA